MLPLLILSSESEKSLSKAKELSADLLASTADKLQNLPDYYQLDPNPSITIDQVRHLIRSLSQKPYGSNHSVAVIISVDLATTEAQNALLNLLEEPPSSTQIILTTENISSLLPTVVSRCRLLSLLQTGRAASPESVSLVEFLLKNPPSLRLKKIDELALPKTELLSFLSDLILASEKNLPRSQNLLKALILARSQVNQNANIRLCLANLLQSTF